MLYTLDVTAWDHPMTVATFRVPDGEYVDRGLRFGPHQFAETIDAELYSPKDNGNLLYLAYFSAGLRVLDVSDPFHPTEVGHYVPATTERTLARPSRFEHDPALQGLDRPVIPVQRCRPRPPRPGLCHRPGRNRPPHRRVPRVMSCFKAVTGSENP